MKDTLISFETAKLAEKKGFDIRCKNVYRIDIVDGICYEHKGAKNGTNKLITAPTQSLLQKWLREVHKIDIYINKDSYGIYHFNIDDNKRNWYEPILNRDFEGGLETVLQTTLKLLPDEQ